MPQFNIHTPKTQGDMAAMRNASRKSHLPCGVIGESSDFSYGYNGEYYYVTEGVMEYLVTKVHLTLDEAKSLFDALCFAGASEPSPRLISLEIKKCRRLKLSGDNLMWSLFDSVSYKPTMPSTASTQKVTT